MMVHIKTTNHTKLPLRASGEGHWPVHWIQIPWVDKQQKFFSTLITSNKYRLINSNTEYCSRYGKCSTVLASTYDNSSFLCHFRSKCLLLCSAYIVTLESTLGDHKSIWEHCYHLPWTVMWWKRVRQRKMDWMTL